MDVKFTGDKASSFRADLVSALTPIRDSESMVATVIITDDHPNLSACAFS